MAADCSKELTPMQRLYDLGRDRVELNNLAADKPDLVTGLRDRWTAWATESNTLPLFADRKKPKK